METRANRHVLVGVNGSEQSLFAADVGAGEAVRRGLPLRLVCAYPQPADGPTATVGVGPSGDETRRRVAAAAARVRGEYPELVVTVVAAAGDLASVVMEEIRRADLVVVGDDGRAGFPGLVTMEIVTHVDCPVIVARSGGHGTSPGDGPVVVGLKGRGHDAPAITFALEEAALRSVSLRAVHVWVNIPDMELASVDPFTYDLTEARRDADRMIDAALAGWSQKYPQVSVERLPIYQLDVEARLTEASAGAGLLVLGSHGSSSNGGRLGSVSRTMITRSSCPVALVRQPCAIGEYPLGRRVDK